MNKQDLSNIERKGTICYGTGEAKGNDVFDVQWQG